LHVWEYCFPILALAAFGCDWNWGNCWFKPFSDPRESLLFSGLHVLCPYLEVNRLWSSLGVTRRFVVVDAAFLVTDGDWFRQIILEAVSRDIRVAVSIWLFFLVFSCFLLFWFVRQFDTLVYFCVIRRYPGYFCVT
jgi:hypothetical protein